MDPQVDPVANRELHALAEAAALEAYRCFSHDDKRCIREMDKAAAKVFRAAGTPTDAARFYACCVTSLVLEREIHRTTVSAPPGRRRVR